MTLACVLLLAELVTFAGCGSSSSQGSDREDALGFVRAADQYRAARERAADRVLEQVRRERRSCAAGIPISASSVMYGLSEDPYTVPAYLRYSAALTAVHPRHPVLRHFADAVATLAAEAKKMRHAPFDLCRFAKEWRAAHKPDPYRFPLSYLHRICVRAGYDARRALQADVVMKRAAHALPGLTEWQRVRVESAGMSGFVGDCRS